MEESNKPTQQPQDDQFLAALADSSVPAEASPPDSAQPGGGQDAAPPAVAPAAAATAPDAQPREARIQTDLAGFAAAFPQVFAQAENDPGVIPQCVWDMMHSQGLSLTAAYARYVTEQANIAADKQRNSARSTGSMRSAGGDAGQNDPFLSAFDA